MKITKKLSVLLLTVAFGLLATSCGSTDDGVDPDPVEETQPSLTDQLEGDYEKYIIEAENPYSVYTTISKLAFGNEGKSSSAINYASNDGYVSYLNTGGEAVLTYKFTAAADAKAVLSVCMGRRENVFYLNDLFTITLNGNVITPYENCKFDIYETVQYYDWQESEVQIVDVQEGENEIVFTKTNSGLNFDYFAFYSPVVIESASEHEHIFEDYTIALYPSATETGIARGTCTQCLNALEITLPVLNEVDYGYTVQKEPTATEFGIAEWSYDVSGTSGVITKTFTTYLEPTNGVTTFKFEAESAGLDGSAKVSAEADTLGSFSGAGYVGQLNNNSGSITMNLWVEDVPGSEAEEGGASLNSLDADNPDAGNEPEGDQNPGADNDGGDQDSEESTPNTVQALLRICLGTRNSIDLTFDRVTIKVNDVEVDFGDIVIPYLGGTDYFDWHEYDIGLIDLVEGDNVVEFSLSGGYFTNVDYFTFTSVATIEKG